MQSIISTCLVIWPSSGSVLNRVGDLAGGDNSVKTTLDSPDLRAQMVGKMGLGRCGPQSCA